MAKKLKNAIYPSLLLRLGLAFVFAYAAISSLRHPIIWAVYLPNYLTHLITAVTLIKLVAIYELALSVWLITGKWVKYAALISAITLIGIVVMNPSQLMTTFRDIGLIFMAAALFLLE